MIVCLRTVVVPAAERDRYLAWIHDGRAIRQAHGLLAEWVLEPAGGDTVVVTVWPSHEVFDAWIATPERVLLTASAVHRAVDYRPITRYEVVGGYTNLGGSRHCPRSSRPDRIAQQGGPTMKWVTRARPKTDRIACPWLIRRFIDAEAEILYVPTDEVLSVAEAEGAHSFDAPGATYQHRDGMCTFEVLIDDYDLGGNAALARLARIVHAADIASDLDSDAAAPGLLAIGLGGLDVEADDHRLLDRASFVYDALYAWSASEVAKATA